MFFKNVIFYRIEDAGEVLAGLDDYLKAQEFTPCQSLDPKKTGWVPPIAGANMFIHSGIGKHMICLQEEEKIIPAAGVKNLLEAKVDKIQKAENRRVCRKERQEIKEEIIYSQLPRALSRIKKTYAYIDERRGLLIVDAATNKAGEKLCSSLRDAIGSLKASLINTNIEMPLAVERWLNGAQASFTKPETNSVGKFTFGSSCSMAESSGDRAEITCKNEDITNEQIIDHLILKSITRVSLSYDKALTFTLTKDLTLKQIKFSDEVKDTDLDSCDSKADEFDANFCIMQKLIGGLFDDLVKAFGGEREH